MQSANTFNVAHCCIAIKDISYLAIISLDLFWRFRKEKVTLSEKSYIYAVQKNKTDLTLLLIGWKKQIVV